MPHIKHIVISEKALDFLKKRQLFSQYQKAQKYIFARNFQNIDFKMRQPKRDGIYYFRINKQFRAIAFIEETTLKIFKIDNHQN